jgi:hypothetical protein
MDTILNIRLLEQCETLAEKWDKLEAGFGPEQVPKFIALAGKQSDDRGGLLTSVYFESLAAMLNPTHARTAFGNLAAVALVVMSGGKVETIEETILSKEARALLHSPPHTVYAMAETDAAMIAKLQQDAEDGKVQAADTLILLEEEKQRYTDLVNSSAIVIAKLKEQIAAGPAASVPAATGISSEQVKELGTVLRIMQGRVAAQVKAAPESEFWLTQLSLTDMALTKLNACAVLVGK